ncbi:MAG: arginine--tRNA ligase [Methanobacteriota archaeon]|nr:MAG: arginine--tRNA ligase [Euryarchaeota archaeon]
MFKEFQDQVASLVDEALQNRGLEADPVYTIPTVESFGDLSTNVAFQLASTLKKAPAEIARSLAEEIKPAGLVKEVKAAEGYLNFYLDYRALAEALLPQVGPGYGRGRGKEKVIIEHTSANPDGPLHIGHLRNAVIGDTLARIMRFAGYDVEVHYYLNDMGKQAAKVVWGRRRFRLEGGKKDAATARVYIEASRVIEEEGREDELSQMLSQYEAGDEKVVEEFKAAVEYCLEGIKETLTRLGIRHDRFVWESAFVRDGSVEKIIHRLASSGHGKKVDGALMVDLSPFGIEKEMVLTRSDGTSLYIARDLAHHAWKLGRGRAVNVWGADHKLVASQLSAALTILGFEPPEFIIHEFISLPTGGMSTRKGVFISADELIEETVEKALEEVESRRSDMAEDAKRRIAEHIGVAAVRFNIARIAPEKSMVFKWDEALDFERQGAPFIQYAYARGIKILQRASTEAAAGHGAPEPDPSEKRLLKVISRFPLAVEEAAASRKVSTVAAYTIELANTFHSFYMSSRVLGSDREGFRLSLVKAAVHVLGSAMELLGIERLDEM